MSSFRLENIVRKNIRDLVPYSSARSEFEGKAKVFLDANENSLGSVAQENFSRYPDPLQKDLKQKISEIKHIRTEHIFVGNGSDEAIDLLIRAFCNPSIDNILICPPTYGMYQVCADINDVAVKKVLLTPAFGLDIEAIKKDTDEHTKLIFICSPNNPTGNLMCSSHITSLLEDFSGIVVIDEAYIDFADVASWSSQLDAHPNLVVLQTLSKAWGLAALRIGLAFASTEIIGILNRIKPPYNISGIAQQLSLDALSREVEKNQKVEILKKERAKLQNLFSEFRFIEKIYSSDANFLLLKTTDAARLYDYLVANDIVVRNRSSQPLCENCLRVTVGTPGENELLAQVLKNYSL